MSQPVDVVIVGAGVAGCATALGLAARGHRVAIVDRREFPREKPCGEGLMPHGVAALARLGITVQGMPFEGIRYGVGEVLAEGRFPTGQCGRGVRRHAMDEALVGRCIAEERIEVFQGVRGRGVERDQSGVVLQTDQGPIRARVLVGADGLMSPCRKWLGLDAPASGRIRYGVRQHFRVQDGRGPGPWVEVHLADGMEWYLTPTGEGELNLAVLVEKEAMGAFRGDPAAGLQQLAAQCPVVARHLEGAEPVTDALVVGPLRQEPRDLVADRGILVGDAAGFLDAITGEGMSIGLLGAEIAVDELHQCLSQDTLTAAALTSYARRVRARRSHLTTVTRVVLWGIRHRWLARWVIRNLARHPDVFGRVLAVNSDQAPLTHLGLGGVRRLVLGW